MSMEHDICYTTTGKLSRRLGSFERYFLAMAEGSNTCYINTVLLLESKVQLDQDHAKKALLMLLERFPLLRMRVTERSNQPCFEEMENAPQSMDFRRMENVDSENWLHAFEKQINGAPFNTQQGPLWRVSLLRETCDATGQEIVYKNTLLFTFHHVICDALSIFELKKKLVEFLGLLYNGEAIEECQPKIESEGFGLYVSFAPLQIMVNSSNKVFWEFARACTNEVHRDINAGNHRNTLKLLQCVNVPSFWTLLCYETEHGLSKSLFNLTNLGALSIDQEGKSPYKFAGSYLAVQIAPVGFVMGNNIFTVNDRLYWTVEYSPDIITKSQAEEFVDLSLRILMDACAW
ncbi:hypothetical protein OS493_033313 [Desmophyllum pertusum]|uniref:Condensation domain-containing protein n=1 Tax=Desmophyllum pertusum TaxID=174260 RepID=A0A9W9Z8D6_9CNID|nr:hypothetical protein OS493_033313 [Desmophyllum pertusum]